MSRAGTVLLSLGVVLFIALLGWQGFGSVATALAAAGWGLLAVAVFHLLPVVIDALAIETLFPRNQRDVSFRDALLARWTGESVNSLMPAGQIGGPMLMVRYLSQRGVRARDAAAVITISTTMQTVGQMIFALVGVALLSSYVSGVGMLLPVLIVIAVCSLMVVGFFFAQRKGLFARADALCFAICSAIFEETRLVVAGVACGSRGHRRDRTIQKARSGRGEFCAQPSGLDRGYR